MSCYATKVQLGHYETAGFTAPSPAEPASFSTKKNIYLHIGHGKTGTSALQVCLAKSHQILSNAGILYKQHASFLHAHSSQVSSGNLDPQDDAKGWFDSQVLETLNQFPSYHTYIFSCENAFHYMDSVYSSFERHRELVSLFIFLSVRNPAEMLSSEYQQLVKRDGLAISFEAFLHQREFQCAHTIRALRIIEALETRGIPLYLFNYSSLGASINPSILERMNLSTIADRESHSSGVVNRSLTLSELQLTIIVNSLYGKHAGAKLTDELVNRLPLVESDMLVMDSDSCDAMISKMHPIVEQINRRLPQESPLSLPSKHHPRATGYGANIQGFTLNDEQANIARAVLNDIFRQMDQASQQDRARLKELSSFLSATAQKVQQKKQIGIRAAFQMLRFARALNPEDESIRGMLREIKKIVRP